MCSRLLIISVWYILTDIVVIVLSSMIIQNKYNTDICYDGIYIGETMHDLFIAHLIIYLALTITQILSYIGVYISFVKEKNVYMLIGNVICFLLVSLLNGMYLNFILTNTKNCFDNLKIKNFDIYIYFIITFVLSCIVQLQLLIRLSYFAIIQ